MGKDDEREDKEYLWMAVAGGAALGAAALVWLVWYRDPGRRMERLLKRCQERISDIEDSLGQLEASLP